MELCDHIRTALADNKIPATEEMIFQLAEYLLLLQKWNRAYNLTSIKDPIKQVYKHILDSLSIRAFLKGNRILDVGSGAGLPGIPLAITCPDKQFTLLDSNNKKARFLIHAKHTLDIPNIEIEHTRVEEFGQEPGYSSIVSRAFSNIKDMLTMTGHLLADDGCILSMKGVYPSAELTDFPDCFNIKEIRPLNIIGLDAERHLAIIESASTP